MLSGWSNSVLCARLGEKTFRYSTTRDVYCGFSMSIVFRVKYNVVVVFVFFFFQAEDGIRDHCVTGVQTCALPILPFPRACAWAAEVACALGVAHRKGVIHGDVKPANMLITDDGRLKLMDFGMARLASRDSKATPLVGTPAYWCPEQIMGKPQDARSDLFSLGVVLYEMVTGKRPFDADSLQAICSRVLSSTDRKSVV